MPWERSLKLASFYQLGALASLFAVTCWRWPAHAVAVLAAGLLMAANFWLLRVLTQRVFAAQRAQLIYALLLVFKLALVMALLAASVLHFGWHPLAVGAGMATLIPACYSPACTSRSPPRRASKTWNTINHG